MNQALSICAGCVGSDHHIMQTAEYRQQGIVGILAGLDPIEIDTRSSDYDSRL